MTGLRAIMVAVDYSDLLEVTLPYNRHHFDEVHIVTDEKSVYEVGIACLKSRTGPVEIWATDLFYADGAKFNKWRALEWGLDQMGRDGWICLMDADVLWPKQLEIWSGLAAGKESLAIDSVNGRTLIEVGQLLSPLRRMAPWPLPSAGLTTQIDRDSPAIWSSVVLVPKEEAWSFYPVHRNVAEWAGYTQIFHASDPHLPAPPWHDTGFIHAGAADSLFQRLWPATVKVRPSWDVLHLGNAGENWFGRSTPRADGSVPVEGEERRALCAEIWRRRSELRATGATEAEQFAPEKLG